MNTKSLDRPSDQQLEEILLFIKKYRELEKSSFQVMNNLLLKVCNELYIANHLIDHWRGNEKDFGRFYLNLSTVVQIGFLNHWQIIDVYDNRYIGQVKESEIRALWADPPLKSKLIKRILLFFNNHAIQDLELSGLKKISFPSQPSNEKKCFGNSSNWADYILFLDVNAAKKVLMEIFENYAG